MEFQLGLCFFRFVEGESEDLIIDSRSGGKADRDGRRKLSQLST
jgi:hypothetical protein